MRVEVQLLLLTTTYILLLKGSMLMGVYQEVVADMGLPPRMNMSSGGMDMGNYRSAVDY
jgi:hypothetical protein